tara:strand:- start:610 stop:1488 length:879 start_codon:yes stop_codon:yes gene_type:complete
MVIPFDMTPSTDEEEDLPRTTVYGAWREVSGFSGNILASENGFVWQREARYGTWMAPRPGSLNAYGYLKIKYAGKTYNVHRLVCAAFHGEQPDGTTSVDHINRDKTDNRASNLRWSSPSQQCHNRNEPVSRRDSKPIWVWKLGSDPASATRFASAYQAAKALPRVEPSNLRAAARGDVPHSAGYCARFDTFVTAFDGEIFRPIGNIGVSQHGRMKTFHGLIVTPTPLAMQVYATYDNTLFHRLVAMAWPDIVGPQPDDPSYTIDHINRDTSDNRATNLRWASKSDQRANQSN